MRIILQGIVGSQAYGMAGPNSDVDRLGVFVTPTIELFGFSKPEETHVTTDPDVTLHEVGKYVRLALQCNPTALELLFLPKALYEYGEIDAGLDLIEMRDAFLSERLVRNSYLGYASQQFIRMGRYVELEGDRVVRMRKNARHVYRLLHQGFGLYSTGELQVRLDNPKLFLAFGEEAVTDRHLVEDTLREYEDKFNSATSPLPDKPDTGRVEDWLIKLRKESLAEDWLIKMQEESL